MSEPSDTIHLKSQLSSLKAFDLHYQCELARARIYFGRRSKSKAVSKQTPTQAGKEWTSKKRSSGAEQTYGNTDEESCGEVLCEIFRGIRDLRSEPVAIIESLTNHHQPSLEAINERNNENRPRKLSTSLPLPLGDGIRILVVRGQKFYKSLKNF